MKGGNFRSETWFPHFHAGDKTAGGNNSSSLLLLEGRESLRISQCSLHTVKDPAGALTSPAYGTCYNLSLSPLIIANQQRAFYATVIWDCDLWTWHRLWLVDMAQDNSCPLFGPDRLCKILRQNLRAFPDPSGTQSIQINTVEVEFCCHFCPLPSRAGVPWTARKDSVPWSNKHKRQIGLDGEGEKGASEASPLPLEKEQSRE